jgi:2'-5' RNA ligase
MGRERVRTSYAVWLTPRGKVRDELARKIRELSREYATPVFEPHVTLVSGILGSPDQVMAKSAKLAAQVSALVVRLTKLDWLNEYFRCVFVRVAKSRPLVEANRRAKMVFGLERRRAFMPHLSLLYGNLAPRVKKRIVAALGRRWDIEFEVSQLDLVALRGEPHEWRRVKAFRVARTPHRR